MAIYLINLVMIIFYYLIYAILKQNRINSKKLRKWSVAIITLQLILILALRDSTVGIDVSNYLLHFRFIAENPFSAMVEIRHELGYKVLNKVVSFFSTNNQVFLTIVAILSIAPVGRFIYKNSRMPFLSFIIYIAFNYYSFVFSGLRQAIAYGIIFISYDYIKNRKLAKFLICVSLASLFHKSALIFLPAYFLYRIKLNKKVISFLVLFDLIIFIYRREIFAFFINNFYQSYSIVESDSYSWMIFCTIIVLLSSFFYKKMIKISPDNNGLFIFLLVGISLMLFASVGTNVMRVADYYYMFVIIFIPEVMTAIKDEKLALLVGYLLIIGLVILYLWFLSSSPYQIVPYKFFW